MGFFDIFRRDEDTLYISLDELPNPPHTAVFSVSFGSREIAAAHLSMNDVGVEKACRIVAYHSAHIKRCSYRRIEYQNLSDFAKTKIEATLAAGAMT
jgi:hypothetical protein